MGEVSPGVNAAGTHSVNVIGPLSCGEAVGIGVPIGAERPIGVGVELTGVALIGAATQAAIKLIDSAAKENRIKRNMLTLIYVLRVRREDYSMVSTARLFAATGQLPLRRLK